MIPGNANPLLLASAAADAAAAGPTKSLRFNSEDSAYLSRTPSSASNRRTWTWAGWIKLGKLSNWGSLFKAGDSDANPTTQLYLYSDNTLEYITYDGSTKGKIIASQVFRDPSAWYHIVLAIDTTDATADNRQRLYINGVEVTDFGSRTNHAQNYETFVNSSSYAHEIGRTTNIGGSSQKFFDGYMADIHFIDGSALDPTSFGAFDDNGVWQSAAYSGTYGTNGFHLLDFANESTIGHDSSGNENDFTANNITNETPTSLPAVSQTKAGNSYLSVPASDDFDFGTGDFTIEFFLYVIRSGSNNAIFDFRDSGSSAQYFLRMTSSTSCNLRYSGTDLGTFSIASGSWNHVAISRSSGTTKVFVDGTQTNSFSDTNDASNTGPLLFGTFNDTTGTSSSYGFDGQISNLRIVKGTAVYTSAFTTPTAPLSNITNTKLLCCQSNTSAIAATVAPGTLTASNATAVQFSDSSSDQDVLFDVPTNGTQSDTGAGGEVSGNYAVLNPLHNYNSPTYANGNLEVSNTSTGHWKSAQATIGVTSGKWYWESTMSGASQYYTLGVAIASEVTNNYTGSGDAFVYDGRGFKNGPGVSSVSYGATYTSGDTIGVALDLDAGTLVFYKNGVSQGTAFSSGLTGKTLFPQFSVYYTSAVTQIVNFGQRAFAYSAPSGYKALNTASMSAATIADGSDYFDVVTYTGNGNSTRTISSIGFSPDLVFTKARNQAYGQNWYDIVRTAGKVLRSDLTDAEATNHEHGYLSAFNSDGYTMSAGTTSSKNGNELNTTYCGWLWDAGSSTVSNTDGSITSSVRANATAGFSIVTATSQASGTGTVGHGLGVAPSFYVVKTRGIAAPWYVYSNEIGAANIMKLNATEASSGGANIWNSTDPTSTVFSLGSDFAGSLTFVAYCFAPVAGYSAMSVYSGNSSTDGPMVVTNFRPRFVLIKATNATANWVIHDSARDTFNEMDAGLYPHSSSAEETSPWGIDFLSNGFKLRTTNGGVNQTGLTYLYYAVAENPFQANGGLAR